VLRKIFERKGGEISRIVFAAEVRPALYWDVALHRLVSGYRGFEAACPAHLQGSSSPRRIHGLCNKNQQDALFSFKFIPIINLYMFRAGSSSGGTVLYITAIGICRAFMLAGC
jgi:hypothetical protein